MKALTTLACALFLAVASAAYADPGDLSPADNKALHDYTLSMDKVRGMQGAMDEAMKLEASDPSFKNQLKAVGDNSGSIAQMEAKLGSNPKLVALYRKYGLTPADGVLLPLTLMSAGIAAEYPAAAAKLAQQTSPAQIAFYKQHKKEIAAMKWMGGQ